MNFVKYSVQRTFSHTSVEIKCITEASNFPRTKLLFMGIIKPMLHSSKSYLFHISSLSNSTLQFSVDYYTRLEFAGPFFAQKRVCLGCQSRKKVQMFLKTQTVIFLYIFQYNNLILYLRCNLTLSVD